MKNIKANIVIEISGSVFSSNAKSLTLEETKVLLNTISDTLDLIYEANSVKEE